MSRASGAGEIVERRSVDADPVTERVRLEREPAIDDCSVISVGREHASALRKSPHWGTNGSWQRERSLPQRREEIVERSLARSAFLDRQYGSAAVVVDDRDIEPGLLLDQLYIPLHLRFDRRQTDQEQA